MAWDPTWEQVFRTQNWGQYPGEDLVRFAARNFRDRDRSKVQILEIGCGPGANIWYLAREGFRAYGIDGSEIAIEQCEARLKREGLKANLTVGDVLSLDFPDGFFDAVIDIECLCCNNRVSTEKILSGIKRVLKPGGLLYSRTFTSDLYIGEGYRTLAPLEFDEIKDGPLAGKGFLRLADRDAVESIYGQFFAIEELELATRSFGNMRGTIAEWEITCRSL